MQKIPRVIPRSQTRRIPWIRHHLRKVHHRVKRAAPLDPRVDPLPGRLAHRVRVRLDRIVGRAKRRNRRRKDG